MYTMNKRVFQILAYIKTTPQDELIDTILAIKAMQAKGKYAISHGNVNFGNNHTITDIRNISRLAEPLTGKVALVDISSLVLNGNVKLPQKWVVSPSKEDHHYTYLHLLHKVKFQKTAQAKVVA